MEHPLSILEDTLGINFIGLNEEEENPWEFPVGKLISLLGTSDMRSIIVPNKTTKDIPLETTTDRPLRSLYEGTSTLRFGPDIEDNPFCQSSGGHKPVVST